MNYNILRSRTFWTIVAMALIGAGNALVPVVPVEFQALVISMLATLGAYFHNNTAQRSGAVN